jgi:hypothetical protein
VSEKNRCHRRIRRIVSGRHIDKLSPSGMLAIKEIKVHTLDIERNAKILIGLLLFA